MLFFCLICRKFTASDYPLFSYLCPSCLKKVDALRVGAVKPLMRPKGRHSTVSVWVLFEYRSFVRDLILRAKVKNDFHALRCLCYLAESCSEILFLVNWADIIIPAPSSLWSRLRGRYDIAGFWACNLAKENDKKLEIGPSRLAYRIRKRALMTPSAKIGVTGANPFINRLLASGLSSRYKRKAENTELSKGKNLLVIDDIMTTGFTMRSIAGCYGNSRIRFLAIAGTHVARKDSFGGQGG